MKSVSDIISHIKVAKEEQPQHGVGVGTGGTGCLVLRLGYCVQNSLMKKFHALKNQVPLKISYQDQAEAKNLEVQGKDLKDQFRIK